MTSVHELFDLSGKVAIITGGDGLLGSQMSIALAEAGAHVVLASLDPFRCKEQAALISENYAEAIGLELDQTDPDSVARMVQSTFDTFGRIDVLVNNAAWNAPGGLVELLTDEEWNSFFSVNAWGVFLCCQAVGEVMKQQRKGSIINIASIYGVVSPDQRIYGQSGLNSALPYGASKAAVIQMTRYLATYWAEYGIRVNSITPGGFFNNQDPEFVRNYCSRVPLGRMGNETDLKGTIVYLASDASAYMTGHNLVLDGGWTAW